MSTEPAPAGRRRPNLIYIFADQLRHDVFGFRGDTRAITPNFDALAAESTSFDNCVVVTPVCAPSRGSLLTGKYTTSTGMVINQCCIHPDHHAIAYSLHDAGYRTGYLGKWHLVDENKRFIPSGPARLGFQHADLFRAYSFNHWNYRGFYWEDRDGVPERHPIEGYETFAWTDMAMQFIEESAREDRPFALFLSYSPPHDPWTQDNVPPGYYAPFRDVAFPNPPNFSPTPDPYADRDNSPEEWEQIVPRLEEWRRCYYAMVHLLDHELGRMRAMLRQNGLEEDTILVYSSDHGEMMGAHGHIQKQTFYDESTRVPFIVRWPGRVPAGRSCDACLNTPDIAPTLLGLLEIPVPDEMEGTDVSRRAMGLPGPEPELALMQGTGHTYLWTDGSEWRAIRTKRHTYARYLSDGSEHLYDNIEDPYQMRNVAAEPDAQPLLQSLRDAMAEKMRSLNDEFWPCSWYREHWMAPNDEYSIIAAARGPFGGLYQPVSSLQAKE